MDVRAYERRLNNRIYVLCVLAAAAILAATSFFLSDQPVRGGLLALVGAFIFSLAGTIGSVSEQKGCVYFAIGILSFLGLLGLGAWAIWANLVH